MSKRERHKCLDVLGLPHSSSDDEIKKAFRKLARQYHPDKNTDDGAKEQFQEISYAYKYLIEGPDAVGAEDEDDGIPLEVLIRLFPWMFQGSHFHHHGFHPGFFHQFHDPFYHGYHNIYVDSDEDEYDDDEEYMYGGYNQRSRSSYVPGPSKEEKKKERKKKARERRKAAKINKAHTNPTPKMDSQQTKAPGKPEDENTGAHFSDKRNLNSADSNQMRSDCKKDEGEKAKNKVSDLPNIDHVGYDASLGPAAQQTQSKKSKKKLKEEQKKREKEMEAIANEFKMKQKEKSEKEAQREAMRKERKESKMFENTAEREDNMADTDSVITGCDDSESVRTDLDADDRAAREEVIDDDVSEAADTGHIKYEELTEATGRQSEEPNRYSSAQESSRGARSKVYSRNETKVTRASRSNVGNETRFDQKSQNKDEKVQYKNKKTVNKDQKSQYKDNRSSSRGAEGTTQPGHSDKSTSNSKKLKRHGRRKEADFGEWEDPASCEGNSPFGSLQPQSEAEEMRMYHEAILISEMEAKEKGVIPETEEEERRMLEAALRESQITAQWSGNMDTLDDVSDGEGSSSLYSKDATTLESASIGDWHKSVGKKSAFSPHDKENITPAFSSTGVSRHLGGFDSVSSFGSSENSGQKDATNPASSSGHFDSVVGGKGRPKTKSDVKKKTTDLWEFGGGKGKKPFQSANSQGLKFGLDDDDLTPDTGSFFDDAHVPEWAREDTGQHGASSSYNNAYFSENSSNQNDKAAHNLKFPNQTHDKQPKPKALSKSGKPAPTASVSSNTPDPSATHSAASSENVTAAPPNLTSVFADMDDIDDVDTFDTSSASAFNSSAGPAGSFDLNIPAAFCNKKIKSYYQRKK